MKLKLNRPVTEFDFDVDEHSLESNGWARIVRCGECKHHEDEEPGMVYCPKIVGSWVSENWYCADGEREVQE
ncbi:MAG: hypothetical protein J6W09_04340 [Bacteroidales bacterium]|nr:hypothetical protein [Bacteroidales bacterium]